MKRSKLLILTATVLAMLMFFTACGNQGGSFKGVLDAKKEYEDIYPSYTKGEKVEGLSGATVTTSAGPLVHLTKQNTEDSEKVNHMVYNVITNSVVWQKETTKNLKISVHLNSVYLNESYDNAIGYFTVTTTETNESKPEEKPVITTTLYSEAAKSVASSADDILVEEVYDLLVFDGKCYRISDDSSITYAFDHSALANIPDINTKYKDLYYEINEEYIAIYNKNLEPVSQYAFPSYADDDPSILLLENGNLFIQYSYTADEFSTDYTVLDPDDGEKLMLVSEILNVKNGTAKQVKTEYYVSYGVNLIQESTIADSLGLNVKKLPVAAMVAQISNQRFATEERFASINNNGKVSEIGAINNDPIQNIYLHADNLWVIETENHSYLVNGKGKTVGDISNASSFGKYFYVDGKIYDESLTMVYDFRSNDLTVKRSVGDSLLFENEDGEILLYKGGSEPTKLIAKDSEKTLLDTSSYSTNGYILIKNNEKLEIYNDQGTLLCTANDINMDELTYSYIFVVRTYEAALLKLTNTSGEVVYYRLG